MLYERREFFYGGEWRGPLSGNHALIHDPATNKEIGLVPQGGKADANPIVLAARAGFDVWRAVAPTERSKLLRSAATIIEAHGEELALLDAMDCGGPLASLRTDVAVAVARLNYFAGLAGEIKGDTIPMGAGRVNYTVHEPLGVVVRIIAFNHPFQFCVSKMAAPLAAGNAVIIKPSEQTPLSALRVAELIGNLFPPGVVNIVTGGRELGEALSSHPAVSAVSLVGSAMTGRAIARNASDTLKRVSLELGGKNALIAFPDADPEAVADAAVMGMNYAWCGQSCGSTSRLFLHEAIHDEVVARMGAHIARYKPGLPSQEETTMGALISRTHLERVRHYVASAREAGCKLVYGDQEVDDLGLAEGNFMYPAVLTDVKQNMRIAREEIFGPVQVILKWSESDRMISDVNDVEYGLSAAIYTRDLVTAHQTAARIEAGYIWINEVGRHFLGAPFGGYKQSGIGREECLQELYDFSQVKNIHLRLDA